MKRFVILILTTLFGSLLAGCFSSKLSSSVTDSFNEYQQQPDYILFGFNHPVKRVDEISYQLPDNESKELFMRTIHYFNKDGFLIRKEVSFDDSDNYDVYAYDSLVYDDHGRIIERFEMAPKYDLVGDELTETGTYRVNRIQEFMYKSEVDTTFIMRSYLVNRKDSFPKEKMFAYNAGGQLLSATTMVEGELDDTYRYTYARDGRLEKEHIEFFCRDSTVTNFNDAGISNRTIYKFGKKTSIEDLEVVETDSLGYWTETKCKFTLYDQSVDDNWLMTRKIDYW